MIVYSVEALFSTLHLDICNISDKKVVLGVNVFVVLKLCVLKVYQHWYWYNVLLVEDIFTVNK